VSIDYGEHYKFLVWNALALYYFVIFVKD